MRREKPMINKDLKEAIRQALAHQWANPMFSADNGETVRDELIPALQEQEVYAVDYKEGVSEDRQVILLTELAQRCFNYGYNAGLRSAAKKLNAVIMS